MGKGSELGRCGGGSQARKGLVRFALGAAVGRGLGGGQAGHASRSWEEHGRGAGVSGSAERPGALISTTETGGGAAVP